MDACDELCDRFNLDLDVVLEAKYGHLCFRVEKHERIIGVNDLNAFKALHACLDLIKDTLRLGAVIQRLDLWIFGRCSCLDLVDDRPDCSSDEHDRDQTPEQDRAG